MERTRLGSRGSRREPIDRHADPEGRAVLEPSQAGHAESVVYEALGVAFAHLSPRENERLRESQGIRHILANERRRIPPRVASRAHEPAGPPR